MINDTIFLIFWGKGITWDGYFLRSEVNFDLQGNLEVISGIFLVSALFCTS